MSLYDHIDAHVGSRYVAPEPPARTSSRGQALMHRFEGLKLSAYPDPGTNGVPWTIGYGTTRYPDGSAVQPGDRITKARADELFAHDLIKFERAVLQAVEVPLTQGQLDALVSFAYNVGKNALRRSTLLRKLNAGDYFGAADEFLRWNRAGGRVMAGLSRRRTAERALFKEQ